eukprot:gnl/Ergobibamus_cyprinoides/787.p1 GENE.gnl/Ergobibamus_cyprinoides/787~~gnl/Ergobibamus_cyprinoides/787.p1  ORF type:complete len:412 (+),score=150.33 gnl/Ergobibamus_cyprinoides/787:26-1237(+)
MEVLQRVAERHGFFALLHEKPFAKLNGSGKHVNWSLATSSGENLFEPGTTPFENAQFLLFLTAVVRAVDLHQDLLRLSVASASNDRRLGGDEAPPAIMSMYVGAQLARVIDSLIAGGAHSEDSPLHVDIGVTSLPPIPRDTSDRNRTSPFAFTGQKWEFRAPGSSFNISCTCVMLNAAVAESLRVFADELDGAKDFDHALAALIRRELTLHRRILFEGNGYSDDWVAEATRRGLLNLKNTPEALERYDTPENLEFFSNMGIYTPAEVVSRKDTYLAGYCSTVHTEATATMEIAQRQIIPACMAFAKEVAQGVAVKASVGIDAPIELAMARSVTENTSRLIALRHRLAEAIASAPTDFADRPVYFAETVVPAMDAVREVADELEGVVPEAMWPFPSYRDLLFYV